eukprot:SAG31_NODE_28738_length_405_cov_2.271242_1_plen_77_part_10
MCETCKRLSGFLFIRYCPGLAPDAMAVGGGQPTNWRPEANRLRSPGARPVGHVTLQPPKLPQTPQLQLSAACPWSAQ